MYLNNFNTNMEEKFKLDKLVRTVKKKLETLSFYGFDFDKIYKPYTQQNKWIVPAYKKSNGINISYYDEQTAEIIQKYFTDMKTEYNSTSSYEGFIDHWFSVSLNGITLCLHWVSD